MGVFDRHLAPRKYRGLPLAAASLAVYGAVRLAFNVAGLRVFGPVTIGAVGAFLALLTILAATLASVPARLAAKLAAEPEEVDEPERAERVLGGAVMATALAGAIAATTIAALGHPSLAPFAAAYVPLFGLYVLFKQTYLALGLRSRYARAELLSGAAFAGVFAWSCAAKSVDGAIASLLLHPGLFALIAFIDHRRVLRFGGGLRELIVAWRRHPSESSAGFISGESGIASYHAVVVAATFFLDGLTLGYFNVLLATASILNVVPTIYGGRLFPELTLRHERRDYDGMRTLVHRSTLGLQALILIVAGPLLVSPGAVLTLLGIPNVGEAPPHDPGLATAWCWLVLAIVAAAPSAPSRYFLDDTRYADRNAMLSAVFLVLGVIGGIAAIAAWGVAGAGIMRFIIDVPLAWGRMALAQSALRWVRGRVTAVVGGQLALIALFSAALFGLPWPGCLALWVAAAVTQGTIVGGLARQRHAQAV